MKLRLFVVLVFFAGAGIVIAFHFYKKDQIQQKHADAEETQVLVTNLSGAVTELFKAGNTLQDARHLSISGNNFWLTKGNYFLSAKDRNGSLYYPISILGFASGPDEGQFKITIRPYSTETPAKNYVYIPSGYFLMGDRLNPFEPQFVWLGAYYISTHEITNGEFRVFLKDRDGYNLEANWTEAGKKWKKENVSHSSTLLDAGKENFGRFGNEQAAVVEVKWYEANAYAKWLTRKYGSGKWIYSLPTEAEWEKAARGPDSFDYGLGQKISDAEDHLYNWKKNPDAAITVVTSSIDAFFPNRYGLYHMSGNVSEWTQSEFLPFNRTHPYDEYERNRDDSTDQRVVRGGSWYSASIALLYLPYRDAFQPELSSPERGFRIVARRLPG